MSNAARDENHIPTLLGVSSSDGTTPVTLYADPTTHRLLTQATGSAAPTDATYVTLTTNATLTNERVLTGTANQITLTDNGAGSTIVLSLPQSIATSSTPTFASMTLTAASSLTLGTASTNTGAIILKNSSNANTTTIQSGAAGASIVFTLPTDDGDSGEVLTTNGSGVLSWEAAGSGANVALSNLVGVALNTALLPDAAAADDFGSATLPFKDIFLAGSSGTPGTNNFKLTGASTSGTRTITLPNATDTLVGKATTDTFTNKTYDTAGSGNAFSINGTAITAVTGTGSVVLATSPTLVTPVLGVATATSINKVAITAPASSATLTLTDGKTLSVTNTLTLSGTDSTTMTFPTTSATLARTDAANTFTGASTASAWVLTSPTITTSIVATTDDGAAIGDATHNFSDLFLASGALVNFANGNAVITHSSGILTVSTGDLRVTTAGTNSASAVTVGGTQTLTSKTLTSPTLTTPSAFTTGGTITLAENTSIALDPAGSADGKYTGITIAGTAGATLAFGDLVYLAAADSRWELTDADAASTSGDVQLGMCVLAAAADGDPTTLLLYGTIRADAAFPALTISAPAYVSTTAGDIQTAQPSGTDDVIRRVGFALTADELLFNPSQDYVTHT